MIGGGVSIISSNHICTISSKSFQDQGFTREPINISSNVWIADNCSIVGGISIEKDVVIGAGSVVTKDLESGYIYAGVSAKRIKRVSKDLPKTKIYYVDWI
jgi:maltose O-acetyltransferase